MEDRAGPEGCHAQLAIFGTGMWCQDGQDLPTNRPIPRNRGPYWKLILGACETANARRRRVLCGENIGGYSQQIGDMLRGCHRSGLTQKLRIAGVVLPKRPIDVRWMVRRIVQYLLGVVNRQPGIDAGQRFVEVVVRPIPSGAEPIEPSADVLDMLRLVRLVERISQRSVIQPKSWISHLGSSCPTNGQKG